MSLETESVLNEINNAAPMVAEQHCEHVTAVAEQAAAEVELLTAVIEKVRPALPALGSRVKVAYYAEVEGPGREEKYADWQGLYINRTGDRVGPVMEGAKHGRNRGPYVGVDYFLITRGTDFLPVGQFAEVSYSGNWTCWQNEADRWQAEVKLISPAEALETLSLSTVLSELSTALIAQLQGKKPERIKQARETAERLRALVTLLGGTP